MIDLGGPLDSYVSRGTPPHTFELVEGIACALDTQGRFILVPSVGSSVLGPHGLLASTRDGRQCRVIGYLPEGDIRFTVLSKDGRRALIGGPTDSYLVGLKY